jgi:DNA-binding IclR family transcriptional regulator
VFIDVLEQLWTAFNEEREEPWSLAKLAKRSALPMSTLRRALTDLESADLVWFEVAEDGRGYAALSEEGALLSEELFGFVMSKQSQ